MSSALAPRSCANSARARSLSAKKSSALIVQGRILRAIPWAPSAAACFSSGDM
jgi:hypothetical protein